MVPSSIETFVFFLLLVVPGVVFEVIYEKARATKQVTVFREVCNVTLVGTLSSLVSLCALILIQIDKPTLLVNLQFWLARPHAYEISHAGRILIFALVSTAASSLIAALFARIVIGRRTELNDVRFSPSSAIHNALLTGSTNKDALPQLQVHTLHGTIGGTFEYFDQSASLESGWLILRNAHFVVDGKKQNVEPWQRVAIPYAEISNVLIQFITG